MRYSIFNFFFNFKIFFIYGTTVDFKKLNLTEKI